MITCGILRNAGSELAGLLTGETLLGRPFRIPVEHPASLLGQADKVHELPQAHGSISTL